jgi:hypothetical protein
VTNNNRSTWALDGGSIKIEFHHPFTYVWFNLGLGAVPAAFNISLTPMPLNETGNGTICIPKFPLPADLSVAEGDEASLQVVTVGDSGSALYNVSSLKAGKSDCAKSECSVRTSDSALMRQFSRATNARIPQD